MHLVHSRFQIKIDGRTANRHARDKQYYKKEFEQICEFFACSETTMQMRQSVELRLNTGMFTGKHEKTDEFLLLTPRGALRRVARRLFGSDSWDKEILIILRG